MDNRPIAIAVWTLFVFLVTSLLTVGPANLIFQAMTDKPDSLPPFPTILCLLVALLVGVVVLTLRISRETSWN